MVDPSAPILLFGICSILAGILTLVLPETRDTKLPDSIQVLLDREKDRLEQIKREIDRERQRKTERDRERETETDTERSKQRGRDIFIKLKKKIIALMIAFNKVS